MMSHIKNNERKFPWQGLTILLFILTVLFWPVRILAVLRLLFGAYALVDGLMALIVSNIDRHEFYHKWMLQLRGLVSIVLGMGICVWSSVTAVNLVTVIATWALLAVAFEVVAVNVIVSERPSWGNLFNKNKLRLR